MSAEFEELMKARDNPSEEAQSTAKWRKNSFCFDQRFYTFVHLSTVLMCECINAVMSVYFFRLGGVHWWGGIRPLPRPPRLLLEVHQLEGSGGCESLPVCVVYFVLILSEVLWLLIFTLPEQKLEYIAYLSSFDQLFDIPKDRKNAEYKK